jgi:hypothetical protein
MRGLRHLIFAAALMIVPAIVLAGDAPTAPQRFGAEVRVKKAVNIGQLAKDPAKFKGKTVRLEGTVKEVCQGKGCWVEVEDASGASFMARSLNETVLLPKDCKGQHVVVEGLVTTLPKAAAEEAEPKDHACPRPNYVVSTRGIELSAAVATPAK